MRKLLIVLLLVGCLCGCASSPKVETARIVTLAKDDTDEGLVLFLDADGKLIEEKKISYPYKMFYYNGGYYYSEDGVDYQGLDMQTHKSIDAIKNLPEGIIGYNGSGYFSYLEGGVCMASSSGEQSCIAVYLSCSFIGEDYFYFIDTDNNFYSCSKEDFSVVNKQRLENSSHLKIVEIDGKYYVAADYGFCLIEAGKISTTYVYPISINCVDNVIGDIIVCDENGERGVYRVSFDKYGMVLDPVYDEIYYRSIVFDEEYSDYYEKGYCVVDYYVIGE